MRCHCCPRQRQRMQLWKSKGSRSQENSYRWWIQLSSDQLRRLVARDAFAVAPRLDSFAFAPSHASRRVPQRPAVSFSPPDNAASTHFGGSSAGDEALLRFWRSALSIHSARDERSLRVSRRPIRVCVVSSGRGGRWNWRRSRSGGANPRSIRGIGGFLIASQGR